MTNNLLSGGPMPSYTATYPALNPLASGNDDMPASAIAQGDPLDDDHIIQATMQHKMRKVLRDAQLATPEEVVRSKIRKTLIVMENAELGVGGPAWAVALQNSFDGLTKTVHALATSVDALTAAVHHPTTGLEALAHTINDPHHGLSALADTINHPTIGLKALENAINHTQTGLNTLASQINAPTTGLIANFNEICRAKIIPLCNRAGELPGADMWFPKKYSQVETATGLDVDRLLNFYGLEAGGTLEEKKERILTHLRAPLWV